MEDSPQGPLDGIRRHWWTALVALGLFVAAGLVFAPGLARHEPSHPPAAPSHGASRGALSDRTPSSQSARSYDSSLDAPPALDGSFDDGAFDCMISPNEVVDIGSAITGLIDAIYVERGDYVEAGQMLAMLESDVEQAAVRVARARAERNAGVKAGEVNLALSRKRKQRATALFKSDSLSRDLEEQAKTEARLAELELERAREEHRVAEIELEQAMAALQRRAILAPVSGLVVERLMAAGEVVERETIMRVAEIDVLRVEVILPSRLFAQVRPGDRAEIVPESPYDQPRSAEVAIADRIIDGASGTFGVRLLLPNEDRALPGGLRCRVRFLH